MKTEHPSFEIICRLPYILKRRPKHVLASCPILDVHSQGRTKKEAKENLIEALSMFFTSCIERDTLDSVLKDCGFKVVSAKSRIPHTNHVDVPIPFAMPLQSNKVC